MSVRANIIFILANLCRVSVDQYERNSVLTVRKAVRADSGKYKIILKNSSGTCEGVADVVVLGKITSLVLSALVLS